MTGNETEKPSKALLFGFLAWLPAAIYSALPSSTFGAPAQFNLTLPIAICLMFGLGTVFALCGAFLCFVDARRISPPQIIGTALLCGAYLIFVAISFAREWH
jgi:hypothetical protein